MTRSIFFKLLVRLLIAAGAALVLERLAALHLRPIPWVVQAGLLLGGCAATALWMAVSLASSLRRTLRPLQTAANELIEGQQAPLATMYRDFNALSYALTAATFRVGQTLAQAAESRRELEALLDSMQDAVVSVDSTGRIQWSNERMQRLIPGPVAASAGIASPVRIGHALVQTVRDPDVLVCVQTALEEGIVNVRRATLLAPGRIFEVIASPMPGGGAVVVLHDVTRIEQVERTQRDFVANVSHELRTPLTSISGYVETLLDHERSVTAEGREFLETILKNASRMNRLTEDLLVMAQVEAAMVKLNPIPVPADTLVRDAIRSMSGLVQENEAQLELGNVTATQVFADADSVLQVLGNLIENAIKYGKRRNDSTARVVLSARTLPEPAEGVEFSVRDFGPGIASEHLDRIFERFYRVDKARSRASGGTGLGLSIARHMVQAQGGSIRAESAINEGSNFIFTLPIALYPAPEQKREWEATN